MTTKSKLKFFTSLIELDALDIWKKDNQSLGQKTSYLTGFYFLIEANHFSTHFYLVGYVCFHIGSR